VVIAPISRGFCFKMFIIKKFGHLELLLSLLLLFVIIIVIVVVVAVVVLLLLLCFVVVGDFSSLCVTR
jgi:hypothetical protein